MKKKKISQKSRRQFKNLLDYYYKLGEEKALFEAELTEESKKAMELLSKVQPWAYLYSSSAAQIIIIFFVMIGWVDRLAKLVEESSRMENYLALFKDVYENDFDQETQDHIDSFTDEEMGLLLAVLFSMLGNLEGYKMYSQSVSSLISDAEIKFKDKEEIDEAMFKAIAVDRSVVAHPLIAKRISTAHILNDEGFLQLLTKSITRTKPRRVHALDDARIMAEFIDEAVGLDTYSVEELAEFFMNDIETYPAERGTSAFKKFLKKHKTRRGN
ncbi:MAG: hypothetical protein DRR42_21825 [Gammaproteobacteria bacterium]|nr:MAG: hypothetical protein DRR42_21825 [Gammaproteobacteria bacterium]